MLVHIVMWNIKEEHRDQAEEIKKRMKQELEALQGQIEGLLHLELRTEVLESGTHELLLYSELEDAKSLARYAAHERHVYAAKNFIQPYTRDRVCVDYIK